MKTDIFKRKLEESIKIKKMKSVSQNSWMMVNSCNTQMDDAIQRIEKLIKIEIANITNNMTQFKHPEANNEENPNEGENHLQTPQVQERNEILFSEMLLGENQYNMNDEKILIGESKKLFPCTLR